MHRFFVPTDDLKAPRVTIRGNDVKHLRQVLRLTIGDKIIVSNGKKTECVAKITEIKKNEVQGAILQKHRRETNVSMITLFQAIPKGTKMDLIIRQATELGICEIVPIVSERVVVKLDEQKSKHRLTRWQRIAMEAAKQSQRLTVPKVSEIQSWDQVSLELKRFDLIVIPWEKESQKSVKEVLRAASKSHKVALVVGPEGGFSKAEVESLCLVGGHAVTLGRNILRTETASLTVLAMVLCELGSF